MAYVKQTWTSGETVTSEKLNHMEDGIVDGGSGAVVFLPYDYENGGGPSCTLGDLRTVFSHGKFPIFRAVNNEQSYYYYYYVDSFSDGGTEGYSFVDIKGTRYQSTSGADDATWGAYD